MTDTTDNNQDPNALGFASINEGMEANFKKVEEIMANFANTHENVNFDPYNLSEAWTEWFSAASKDPQKMMAANMEFMQNSMLLYQKAALSMLGQKGEPVAAAEKGDRRFKHEEWENNPMFDAIKQSYLLTSSWMRDMVADVDDLDAKTAEKMEFFTERYLDAMSPTNFAMTNPAVLEKIQETNGANLVHGLKNMLEDLEDGNGQLRIRMTDTEAFELGKNVAVTPGKVVFQNRMFQLIQYSPSTETAYKRPLLIVPPWINKFYILDLQPKNSMLRWLVEQGHTVFVVSWINPDDSYRDTGWEHYVKEGILEAIDQVGNATGEKDLNVIGYCIGGTLLATALSYMQAKGDDRVKTATFFTTMLDFSDPGELGIFTDEETIKNLEGEMSKSGYLEGSTMAGTFNMLRANDLIWSFYVNNYLLGNEPRPFDLLYWNSDSTRMPCAMHSQYLRNMYLENKVIEPGGIMIDDVPVDISKLDLPVCFISAVDDHIAPWLSTYSGAKMFAGPVKFILGGSGHIAGIVNPPEAKKYGYRVTNKPPADAQKWADGAKVNEGSWWPEWQSWIKPKAGKMIDARQPGDGKLEVIEDAPGSYVKVRIGK